MMNSKRAYFMLAGITFLMICLGVASLYYSNVLLLKKTQGITNIKTEYLTLEQQQKSLVQAKKDIEKFSELEEITKSIVPQEKDQARTVRELVKIAQESGVKIANISFPVSTLGQVQKKPATTQTDDTQKSSDTQQPAQSTPATPQTTQVKAVDGITGVYQMEVSMQSDSSEPIPYNNLVLFLSKLEQNRRTSQVSSLTVTPSVDDRSKVTFSIIINVYLKP